MYEKRMNDQPGEQPDAVTSATSLADAAAALDPGAARRRPGGASPLPASGHLRCRRRHRRHARRCERMPRARHVVGGQRRSRTRDQAAGRSLRAAGCGRARMRI
ncbi:MAG: hypothetical protein V8S24_00615 [Gordonibacter pamelaeae]